MGKLYKCSYKDSKTDPLCKRCDYAFSIIREHCDDNLFDKFNISGIPNTEFATFFKCAVGVPKNSTGEERILKEYKLLLEIKQ